MASFPHSQPALTHPTVEIKAEINPALDRPRLCHRRVQGAEQNRSDPAAQVTSTNLSHRATSWCEGDTPPPAHVPWFPAQSGTTVALLEGSSPSSVSDQSQISGVSENTASHREGPRGTKARVLTQPSGNESELEGDPISFLCSGAA